jgi:hypothetical protein
VSGVLRCIACEAVFTHPSLLAGECRSADNGRCAHVQDAGWRPVWVRVHLDDERDKRRGVLFARGGWLCQACARRYMPQLPFGVRS